MVKLQSNNFLEGYVTDLGPWAFYATEIDQRPKDNSGKTFIGTYAQAQGRQHKGKNPQSHAPRRGQRVL